MYVQYGFLYMILAMPKLKVCVNTLHMYLIFMKV
jgi:hypothetical protein